MLGTQVEKGGSVDVTLETFATGAGIAGILGGFFTWMMKLFFRSELGTIRAIVSDLKEDNQKTRDALADHGERISALEAVMRQRDR